jgi:hypothetical protein
VQAHPPPSTLLVAPFVAAFGVLGAQVAVLLLSLAGLTVSLLLIGRGLGWRLSRRQGLVLVVAAFGAEAVVTTLRAGQTGLVLGALMIAGWYSLKKDRPALAGVLVALAAALKAFPGLLLLYFLLRQRRAFASAIVTLLILFVLVGVLTGWHTYAEYLDTTRGVVEEYRGFANNLSLLALFVRTAGEVAADKAQLVFYGVAVLLVGALAWLVCRGEPLPPAPLPGAERGEDMLAPPSLPGKGAGGSGPAKGERLDLEYALFLAVMPLLSPISWDHYLSVLLLPLAVVGTRALTASSSWRAALGFLGLIVVLSVPDTLFTSYVAPRGGLARLLLLPLRTYAVAALAGWLAVLVYRRGEAAPAGNTAGRTLLLAALLLAVALVHVAAFVPSEPYYNNDETRHVMTGVFVRDALVDLPLRSPLTYAERYYLQYPALGVPTWPPAFYAFEGPAMLAFGTSFLTGLALVGVFAALACVYFFLLAERTHGRPVAVVATLLLALSPIFFNFSSHVMLEVPTLAWSLMACYHFHRYLESARRRDLVLCCLAAALTALTRFDGVYLAPLFLVWLAGARRLGVLRRREVWLGIAGAVLLAAPFYLFAASQVGGSHLKAATEGTTQSSTHFLAPQNFVLYPAFIPEQIGWLALAPALVGLAAGLAPNRRAASWPYLAMLLATYVTFVPLAEPESRHAIYWVPALCLFAADGALFLAARLGWHGHLGRGWAATAPQPSRRTHGWDSRGTTEILVATILVVGTAWEAFPKPTEYVRGYEDAARYVVEHNSETPVCLFDEFLGGNFIYQVRRHDAGRRLSVLRGDKLFYAVLSEPTGGYEELVRGEAEILALIYKYDPELIVVEEPQIHFEVPMAQLLRRTLRNHPERFEVVKVVPLDSNHVAYRGKKLVIYRNRVRNPRREPLNSIRVLGLGRDIKRD